jgi:hypothetical protein
MELVFLPGDPMTANNALRLEPAFNPEAPEAAGGASSVMEWAFESSPLATLLIAPDETILRWNRKAAEKLIPVPFRFMNYLRIEMTRIYCFLSRISGKQQPPGRYCSRPSTETQCPARFP